MPQVRLDITEIKTGKVVRSVGPVPETRAERVLMFMLHNLNKDDYFIAEVKINDKLFSSTQQYQPLNPPLFS